MKKKGMSISTLFPVLLAFSVALVGLTAQGAFAKDKVYTLKIQSAYPHGDISMEALKVFADSAKKRSNGRLIVKVFADGDLIPGDQLFDATKQGVVDMLHAMGGMWGGMVPIGNVEFNLPLAFRITWKNTFEEKCQAIRDFYFKNGFSKLLREEYAKQGLYWLDFHVYGPVPFVLAKKEIKNCDDLKGLKLRCEGINTECHAAAGWQTTVISGLETYMALKLGTVDAAEWDISAVTGLHWNEVAPYWIRGMECDEACGQILVGMNKWKALPDDLKTALAGAAEDYYQATVKDYKNQYDIVEKMVKEGKIKECTLDKACQDRYAAAAYRIWDELAKQSPACGQAVTLIKDWRNANQ
jgi:TRAP-type C4-dicarboxylate transport system substrate-binding protein